MDFWDDDSRPRFLFQSRPPSSSSSSSQSLNKPLILLTTTLSSLLLTLSFLYFHSEPLQSTLIWISLSLLIGPFAPLSFTCGDIRVGQGTTVHFPDDTNVNMQEHHQTENLQTKKRKHARKKEDNDVLVVQDSDMGNRGRVTQRVGREDGGRKSEEEVRDWSEEDVELLKKQMVKNPVGKVRRWEVIAEAFNGRHGKESVIKKAKELAERRDGDGDDYGKFLKNRKAVDTRVVEAEFESSREVSWSAGDDVALLNALKAFPKDVAMRWEKIAAAVPGKTKASCMKRFAELKKDFRSSKAANEG